MKRNHTIREEDLCRFSRHLHDLEYAPGSIEKYLRDLTAFQHWLAGRTVTQREIAAWKEYLHSLGCRSETVNTKLSALNRFFAFQGWSGLRARYYRIQRRFFRSTEREMTREDYGRLLSTAEGMGKTRLALLMETICATGIRVSEVKYITLEALRAGRAEISLKGKVRTILIPGKLCRKLERYAKKQNIATGEIFLTRRGKGLSRRQIWAEMKALCARAGVAASKVFPHNLRHLFARTFYRASRDVAQLADVLGHSSIETTRIYLLSTGANHTRQLERLGLIL
jgi:integrase/recombinase XerD